MAVSVTGIINALDKLSKPLQKRLLKKFNLDMDNLPGRTSKTAGVNVGKERFNRKEIRDQIKGSIKTLGYGGAAYAGYSAGDFISDLLGIKKMGDGTLRAEEKKKIGKAKSETVTPFKKKTVKDTPPKAPPSRPKSIKPKVKPKKKQLMMKDKSGKDTNVKFNSRGGMLKKGKK
jgi:hypothetical protein